MRAHIRLRPRITNFSAKHANWIIAYFRKNSSFQEIKNILKKKIISRDKKHLSSYVFLLVFFLSPSITFFFKCQFLFISSLPFPGNLSNFFVIGLWIFSRLKTYWAYVHHTEVTGVRYKYVSIIYFIED